jgi:hypothetical protein
MKIRELIKKLEMIEQQNGNVEVTIYRSFDKKNVSFSDVCFDDGLQDCYITIYD